MAMVSAKIEGRPWPLEDLLDRAGLDFTLLAELLHVDPTTVWRRFEWGLTDDEADEWACRAGLNPASVWGDAWVQAALALPEPLTLW